MEIVLPVFDRAAEECNLSVFLKINVRYCCFFEQTAHYFQIDGLFSNLDGGVLRQGDENRSCGSEWTFSGSVMPSKALRFRTLIFFVELVIGETIILQHKLFENMSTLSLHRLMFQKNKKAQQSFEN